MALSARTASPISRWGSISGPMLPGMPRVSAISTKIRGSSGSVGWKKAKQRGAEAHEHAGGARHHVEEAEELASGRLDGGRQLPQGFVGVQLVPALDGGFDLFGRGSEAPIEELQEVGALLGCEALDGVDGV